MGSLISWPNLLEAAHRAALGKKSRPEVAAFLAGQEIHLARLRAELHSGHYRPGPYRKFRLWEPKPREISTAPFRDRVVHHALTQILEPIFDRRFVRFSFACRTGLGTHAAVACVQAAARTQGHALACDVRKYFASIDHAILQSQLGSVVRCRQTLTLAGAIISGSNPQEPVDWYFPGDDLFTPSLRRRGLPLGNQTSQFFANVYLNSLDHFVLREIRPRAYARYVDDLVLLDNDAGKLREARAAIENRLAGLRLRLHEGKSRLYRVADGVTFLGWRIFPSHRRLVRPNVVRFRRRLRWLRDQWIGGEVDWDTVRQSVSAWIGHAMHGETWKLREQIFEEVGFPAGDKFGSEPSAEKIFFGGFRRQ